MMMDKSEQGLDKNAPKEEAPKGGNPDSELVSMMGMAMLNKGGLDTISKALETSQDPGQVVGQFMAQLVGQIAEFSRDTMDIEPGIFLEPGGFLDQNLDYIERKLNLPKEFSDQVYGEALEAMKAAAMQPPEGDQPQGGPPAVGPQGPAPQGPMPLDGGV